MVNRVLYISFICLVGCNTDDIDQKKVADSLANRLNDYKAELSAKCRDEAVQRAIIYTDSLVAADYFMELYGGIAFPPKPAKPEFGAPVTIKDTIKAMPIFE